jgi:hypothetical protein
LLEEEEPLDYLEIGTIEFGEETSGLTRPALPPAHEESLTDTRPRHTRNLCGSHDSIAVDGLPSDILSQNASFDVLFALLADARCNSDPAWAQIGYRCWELLQMLPRTQAVVSELKSFKRDWKELLDPSRRFMLLYSLFVIDSFVHPTPNEEWCNRFVSTGGLGHLITAVLLRHADGEAAADPSARRLLLLVIPIVHFFLLDTSKTPFTYRQQLAQFITADFLVKLLQLSKLYTSSYDAGAGSGDGQESGAVRALAKSCSESASDSEAIMYALDLVSAAVRIRPDLLDVFLAHVEREPDWLPHLLLGTAQSAIRLHMAEGLYSICCNKDDHRPGHVVLSRLVRELEGIERYQSSCHSYFLLLNRLLNEEALCVPDPAALIEQLTKSLVAHPPCEVTAAASEPDRVLLGLMSALISVLRRYPKSKPSEAD